MRKFSPGLALLSLILASGGLAEEPFGFDTTPGRLAKTIVPQHYAITIEPDAAAATFTGSTTIEIEVRAPAKEIVLNENALGIDAATFEGAPIRAQADDQTQLLTLTPAQEIPPGHYQLAFKFHGKINPGAEGLYYDDYPGPDGAKRRLLGTQMEATDARRMFPCWDEPAFRATFQLTVILPDGQMAVSNTPVEATEQSSPGKTATTFARTPNMATYLLVFCGGELEAVTDEVDGVQLRVITTVGKKDLGRYTLEITKKILPFYAEYFGVKYPLPKLDQIAIPGGFGGAMENWGGITYNEARILFDPAKSAPETKEDIFATVAHEISHQWFGNLVTMAWWDNLWLNEGFASWMGTKATDHFNPEWQIWLRANGEKEAAMGEDALKTTHPIQQKVETEGQANDAFDDITYLKGQSFIRMLETHLGEEKFRAGIRAYMAQHQYSNTTTADLWKALSEASGEDVASFAKGWTEQPGFPVVSASRDGDQIRLTQSRFTLNDPDAKPLVWQVPVTFAAAPAGKTAIPDLLLREPVATIPVTVGLAEAKAWKLNAGNTGYYRVAYAPAWFDALRDQFSTLSEADELNLLSDTWALVEAGRLEAPQYLQLAGAVRNGTSLAIWEQVLATLGKIDDLQIGQPGREAFHAWGRTLLAPLGKKLGWKIVPGEPTTLGLLRPEVLGMLALFGDPTTIAEAKQRWEKFQQNPAAIPPPLRNVVFKQIGRYGDARDWEILHALGQQATGTEEKRQFYRALQFTHDPALIAKALALSLTDELPPMEATREVAFSAAASEHPELAWEFAKAHLPELEAKLSAYQRNAYFAEVMASFTDAPRADELEAFAREHLPADAGPETHKVAETIRFNAQLKARTLPAIDTWIATQSKP